MYEFHQIHLIKLSIYRQTVVLVNGFYVFVEISIEWNIAHCDSSNIILR